MMSTGEKIVSGVLTLLVGLLVWFGYSHGADNLSVLLTIGGAVVLSILGSTGNSETGMLICVLLVLVGAIFAFTGAGFLVGVALVVGAVMSCIATAIVANA